MPKFFTAFALTMILAAPAFALTTEQGATNSDGTAKFSDPDEQRPGFMNGAAEDEDTGHVQPGALGMQQMQVAPGAHMGVNVNRFSGSQQPDAFDQAFQHK